MTNRKPNAANPGDMLLVAVLGRVDAAFLPARQWTPRARAACIYEARRDYPKRGVLWRPGGNASERKRNERRLGVLEVRGEVERSRNTLRTNAVRLTDMGEARARALAGLPGWDCALATLDELARLAPPGKGVWETWLADVEWADTADADARQMLATVAEMALPALVRGWVVSNSTVQGHVHYALTAAGRAALADWPDLPTVDELAVDDCRSAHAVYCRERDRALMAFDFATPGNVGELGAIPIPVAEAGEGALKNRPVDDAPAEAGDKH